MALPDFDETFDPDLFSVKHWAMVPEPIRTNVEQHVADHLPAEILAKLRDLHARGLPISDDDAFFHFGGGLAVRNLCRQRLRDDELAACCGLGGDWDNCYIGVLAAIAASPVVELHQLGLIRDFLEAVGPTMAAPGRKGFNVIQCHAAE